MPKKKTVDEMRVSRMPWPVAGAIAVVIAAMIIFNFLK